MSHLKVGSMGGMHVDQFSVSKDRVAVARDRDVFPLRNNGSGIWERGHVFVNPTPQDPAFEQGYPGLLVCLKTPLLGAQQIYGSNKYF